MYKELKRISMELKQFLSCKEQLKRLREEKNLIISNEEEALNYLGRVSYYYFSGYLLPFKIRKENNIEEYRPVRFEKIKELIEFDSELKEILMLIISKVERSLRTSIAYYFAHDYEYGNIAYMFVETFLKKDLGDDHPINLKIRKEHSKLMEEIEKMKKNNKTQMFMKHHKIKYNNYIPIWVIIELFTFGNIKKFYLLLKKETKDKVAKKYGIKSYLLENWLLHLRYLRNLVAHDQRIYKIKIQSPKNHPEIKFKTNLIYDYILILKKLFVDSKYWNEVIVHKFKVLFLKYRRVNISNIGFNKNWKKELKKY